MKKKLLKLFRKMILAVLGFLVVTFAIYFFNLDMKFTSLMEPVLEKVYDNFVKRDQHL